MRPEWGSGSVHSARTADLLMTTVGAIARRQTSHGSRRDSYDDIELALPLAEHIACRFDGHGTTSRISSKQRARAGTSGGPVRHQPWCTVSGVRGSPRSWAKLVGISKCRSPEYLPSGVRGGGVVGDQVGMGACVDRRGDVRLPAPMRRWAAIERGMRCCWSRCLRWIWWHIGAADVRAGPDPRLPVPPGNRPNIHRLRPIATPAPGRVGRNRRGCEPKRWRAPSPSRWVLRRCGGCAATVLWRLCLGGSVVGGSYTLVAGLTSIRGNVAGETRRRVAPSSVLDQRPARYPEEASRSGTRLVPDSAEQISRVCRDRMLAGVDARRERGNV